MMTKPSKILPPAAAFATALVLAGAMAGGTARAECIEAQMIGLAEYEQGVQQPRDTFHPNELLVLCFRVARDGYVSIFDAPIEGDFEQLYPNALTHPGGETYTKVAAGEVYCLGTRETFPMYHPPEEGIGTGKISISLTATPEAQLAPEDYAIPGQRVARETMNLHLSQAARDGEACTARDVKYLPYNIVN